MSLHPVALQTRLDEVREAILTNLKFMLCLLSDQIPPVCPSGWLSDEEMMTPRRQEVWTCHMLNPLSSDYTRFDTWGPSLHRLHANEKRPKLPHAWRDTINNHQPAHSQVTPALHTDTDPPNEQEAQEEQEEQEEQLHNMLTCWQKVWLQVRTCRLLRKG